MIHPLPGRQGRFLLLAGLEPELVFPGREVFLGSNIYGETEHPGGYGYLKEFYPFPHPQWRWQGRGFFLEEEYLMIGGKPQVMVKYGLSEGSSPLKLRLKPFLSYRDAHGLTFENDGVELLSHSTSHRLRLSIYPSMPPLHFNFSKEYSFHQNPFWDKNVTYLREMERGFDHTEDRFVPGFLTADLNPGEEIYLSIGLEEQLDSAPPLRNTWAAERSRRLKFSPGAPGEPRAITLLRYRAEQFFVKNEKGEDAIVAGYPWFGEWGRDTMIALPGLTLATGRLDTAASILEAYAGYIREGLLPNTLGGLQGFTSYNSLDASLLYIAAIQAADPLLRESSLFPEAGQFEKRFYRPVESILTAFIRGRVPYTRLGEDGLLEAGNEETQLTWMDAKAWGKPVTPRQGKAVDINALWYNALEYLLELGRRLGKVPLRPAVELGEKIPQNYRKSFWLVDEGYLADCLTPEGPDKSMRPNMLFPLALPYSPLEDREKRGVLEKVEEHLLTPLGVRTLSPEDPRFRDFYTGGPDERDSAYHQGTVWPWLLELYIIGSIRTCPGDGNLRNRLRQYLITLLDRHLLEDGLGSISEIFDGGEPAGGKGCFAQAWSVAAVIRSWEFIEKYQGGIQDSACFE